LTALAAAVAIATQLALPGTTARATGPLATVANWDRNRTAQDGTIGCVTETRWSSYGIEELVKQTLPNEIVDSTYPPEAIRANASVIRQDYWFFLKNGDPAQFCVGVTPYSYDVRDSRMAFVQGSAGINSARATDDTVTKGWLPAGSNTPDNMYLSFGSSLQADTRTQALNNYLWVQIVATAVWPPGEWAPNACCPGGSGNINVVTPLTLTCLYDCTADYDGDGVMNQIDNCPFAPNAGQANTDASNGASNRAGFDAWGDGCDDNISGDGYSNEAHTFYGKDPARYCETMRADIDGSGAVSGLDLGTLAFYFTQSFPYNYYPLYGVDTRIQRANQTGDNVINGLDLGIIAGQFTKSVTLCP